MKKKYLLLLLAVLASPQSCMAMKSSRQSVTQGPTTVTSQNDDVSVFQDSTKSSEKLFSLPKDSTLEIYKSELKDFNPPALGFNLSCNSKIKEGYISESTFNFILDKFLEECPRDSSKLFDEHHIPEKNMILVGDLHGNVQSVKNVLLNYLEEDNVIIFLGDFTDRGSNSLETISLLLHARTLFPDNVFLLRGNHENLKHQLSWSYFWDPSTQAEMFSHCNTQASMDTLRSQIDSVYTDLNVCLRKIMKIYDSLPVGLVLDNEQHRIFCCHGCIHSFMNRKNGLLVLQDRVDRIVKQKSSEDILFDGILTSLSETDEHNDDDPHKLKIMKLKYPVLWNRFNDEPTSSSSPADSVPIADIHHFNEYNSFSFSCFGHVHKNQVTYEDGKIVGISLLSYPNFYKHYANVFDPESNLAGILKISGHSKTLEFVHFNASFETNSVNVPLEIQHDKNKTSALQLPSLNKTTVFDPSHK